MTTSLSSRLRAQRASGLAGGVLSLLMAATAQAQVVTAPSPQGVLNLSATATQEVAKDWMTLVLSVAKEGPDANAVQGQLKLAVDGALAEARKQARPGQLEIQSGNFSIFPRYNNKGVVNGWQGNTEVMIQGRDMAAIAQLTGKVSTMTIASVQYSISREARERLEAEVTAQAIARFKAMAEQQARAFGFAGYTVREVTVSFDQPEGGHPMPMMMAKAVMADSAPLPVEAGKGSVSAVVSGSVQMK